MSISTPAGIDFYRRLAQHAGVAFVTLEPTQGAEDTYHAVEPAAAGLLSVEVCRQFGILPIALHEGMVTIASSEPVQYMAYDVAAALTGRAVNFVIAPADQLERAADAAFAEKLRRERPTAGVRNARARTQAALGELVGAPLRLGDLLVARGFATADQVETALAEQRATGERIGRIFVQRGIVDEWTMTEALAQQREMPIVDLREFVPEPATLRIIPEPIARGFGFLPVAVDGGRLYVASDDVLAPETIERLGAYTTLDIRVLLAPRGEIEALMRRISPWPS
jgi:hypothetical protein